MNKISPTLNCKNIIENRLKESLPIYNTGLGANSLPQPEYLIKKVNEYSSKKDYTSSVGISSLNNILKKINTTDKYKVDQVLVGNGLKELLYIVQRSFKGKIFHITPSWVSYKEQITILNLNDDLIEIETKIEDGYKVNLQLLDDKLNEVANYPKLLLFNNPNNPTGLIYSTDEVKNISQILKKYNCIVFADEIYQNLSHFNHFESITNYIPELTIRGSSVSKDLACGGYRLGWITFPESLKDLFYDCWASASSIYSCPCTPIQYACAEMLERDDILTEYYNKINNIYKNIAEKICNILDKSELRYIKPQSSWYVFASFSNYEKELNNLGVKTSFELAEYLINKIGFVTVAGEAFSTKGLNLRFSLVDIDLNNYEDNNKNSLHMEEGFNILVDFLKKLKY